MNSRSTTFFSSDVYLVQCLPSLFPFSHAGSGLLPSGTTQEASGASQSIPGCLGKKRCRWWHLLGSVLRLLWDDYHVLTNEQGRWVGPVADNDTKVWRGGITCLKLHSWTQRAWTQVPLPSQTRVKQQALLALQQGTLNDPSPTHLHINPPSHDVLQREYPTYNSLGHACHVNLWLPYGHKEFSVSQGLSMFLLKGSEGKPLRHRWWELDRWGPHSLTCRFRFDLLAELGTDTVVVGADVVQTPGGQLVGIVKLQGSDRKGVRPLFSQVGLQRDKKSW